MKSIVIFVVIAGALPAIAGQDAIFSTGYEPSFSVGGNIAGLDSLGEDIGISLNGALLLTAVKDGPYILGNEVEAGQVFDVTIDNSNCTIMNGSGIMPYNDVTNADINCPLDFTTVYDIKQGIFTGDVALQNMLVTTCTDNVGYNLQTIPADPDYVGDDFSGIYVFDSSVDCMAILIGDRVDINPATVNVFFGEIQLIDADYAIQSSGNPPPTPVLTTTAALGGMTVHPLNGVIVEVQNVVVSNVDLPSSEFELDMMATVNDRHHLTTPFPEIGEAMSYVRGPLAYSLSTNKIDPRDSSDLGRISKLVINEVDYDQPGDDDNEFLEILNLGPGEVDLTGVVFLLINGTDGNPYFSDSLDSFGTLGAGEYLVVGDPNVIASLPAGTASMTLPDVTSIQNSVDGIALVNVDDDVLLDALSYEGEITVANVALSSPVSLVEGTAATAIDDQLDGSLVRIPNGQDTDDADTDWQFSGVSTPGLNNDIQMPDGLLINEIDYDQPDTDTAEFVELYNPTSAVIDLSAVDMVLVNGANNLEYGRLTLSGMLEPDAYAVIGDIGLTIPPGVIYLDIG
ncbi:MAG: lamin tail domain-containing protein, partial [Marinicella sp.]